MEFFAAIFGKIVEDGIFSETSLLLVIIGMLTLGYVKIFKPLRAKVNNIPTLEEIEKSRNELREIESIRNSDLKEKLERIIRVVEAIEYLEHNACGDMVLLRADLDSAKQILTQFQGHLMYGDQQHNKFNNRELK